MSQEQSIELQDFLDAFDPDDYPALKFACLPQYVHDDLAKDRFVTAAASNQLMLERELYQEGQKRTAACETQMKRLDFFESNQADWSRELRERLLGRGIVKQKVDSYFSAFVSFWPKGKSIRLKSEEMRAIIASVAGHDKERNSHAAGKFVLEKTVPAIDPLFSPQEMAWVFKENEAMLQNTMEEYFKVLGGSEERSINSTYVRRGMYLADSLPEYWHEAQYLSSYSLMLTVAESFSRTWTQGNKSTGRPVIVSTPLPNIQTRVVAFSGFIEGMPIGQAELVVAPPLLRSTVRFRGAHGGGGPIDEYEYE